MTVRLEIGAIRGGATTMFRVWAPDAERVEVVLADRRAAMRREEHGYHVAEVDGVADAARYRYALDGGPPPPAPASRPGEAGGQIPGSASSVLLNNRR